MIRLIDMGLSDYAVARETGIPHATVARWRHQPTGQRTVPGTPTGPWRPPDDGSYSYLLGLYLGDGHVSHVEGRFARLIISLDGLYPGVVGECIGAIGTVVPGRRVIVRQVPGERLVMVDCYDRRWPEVFPQAGPGRKHERPIVLEPWQQEIVDRYPRELLRGLIHSDGCRTVNRFQTTLPSGRVREYEDVRYFFSNLSEDIRGIFCRACDRLDIRWTKSNSRNISVSHRSGVALLESFVGPKA